MKANRMLAALLAVAMLGSVLSGCQKKPAETPPAPSQPAVSAPAQSTPPVDEPDPPPAPASANIIVLSGPAGVGAAKMMEDNGVDDNPGSRSWNFTVAAENTEVTNALINGDADIAAIATNVAANLYNKTEGGITMLAVNTLGVLYILEKGDSVQSMADLKGKTIYAPSTAKGANPEYILNHLLTENGVDPAADITVEWLTPQEITAKIVSSDAGICMLPVPAATALLLKDAGVREALDLTAEWDKVADTPLAMGCIVARTEFLQQNPDAVDAFLIEYSKSIEYMNDPANLDAAAELVAKHGITANAAIAKAAIPACNLVYMPSTEMRNTIQNYYTVLNEANPAAIGGAMPYDDFYYLVDLVYSRHS